MKGTRRHRTSVLPTILLAALLGACDESPFGPMALEDPEVQLQDNGPHPLARCWTFVQNDGARILGLPWGVELLDAPLEGWPIEGARSAVDLRAGAVRGDADILFWLETEFAWIRVGYAGLGPWSLDLQPEGEALVGVGRSTGDAILPISTPAPAEYRIVAVAVPCAPTTDGG